MPDLIKIAFRNVFRNFRRSVLTIFISFLSVALLVVSSSFIAGMFHNILNESIKFSGHVRLNSKDYDIQERMMSLMGNIKNYPRLKRQIGRLPGVMTVAGRLKFAGLVYKGDANTEALGFGIEAAELKTLDLKKLTFQGRPIQTRHKNEIIVGRKLAESLDLHLGDKVTLLTRTLYGSTGAYNYEVVGVFDLQNGRLNKSFYISLPDAQELLDMKDRVMEVSVFGAGSDATPDLMRRLQTIPAVRHLQLKAWDQIGLGPSLTKIITIVSSIIQLIIIVLAGLGIANTMMMAVFERKSEIGLLKSMGMHTSEITALFSLEGIFLGVMGTIAGLIGGGGIAYLLHTRGLNVGSQLRGLPIVIGNMVYGGFDTGIFLKGIILGLGAALLASLLPAINGVRLKPTDALRKE